jgi:hypothetical protein
MFRKLSILFLVLLSAVILITGCSGTSAAPMSEDQNQTSRPTNTSIQNQTTSPPPKPAATAASSKKQKGITGNIVMCPEAKGKIELSCEIISGWSEVPSAPAVQIAVTVKNASNEAIKIVNEEKSYNAFSLKLLSQDKNGSILGQPQFVGFSLLAPKESASNTLVFLFSSSETTQFSLILGYKKAPDIKGTYKESPEIAGKLGVTYTVRVSGDITLLVSVKNISGGKIGGNGGTEDWVMSVKFRDASGNIVQADNGAGKKVDSPEYVFAGLRGLSAETPREFGFWVPDGAVSYELRSYTVEK